MHLKHSCEAELTKNYMQNKKSFPTFSDGAWAPLS